MDKREEWANLGLSDDVIVVGAAQADDNCGDSGSAYVFVKPVGGWNGNYHLFSQV